MAAQQLTDTLTGNELPPEWARRLNVLPDQVVKLTVKAEVSEPGKSRWKEAAEALRAESLFEGRSEEVNAILREARDGFQL